MGIPETILFRDAEEALQLYDVGDICEPDCEIESIVMAHALVNSAPLIAGMIDPDAGANSRSTCSGSHADSSGARRPTR